MTMLGAGPVDFSSKWSHLSDVVVKLLRCEAVSRDSWNSSFHDIFALCNSRPVWHAPILYSSTTTLINNRIKEIVGELKELDDSRLLPAYVHHWDSFHRGLNYLDQLYRCVNQQYVKSLRPTEADMCYSTVLPMADRHTMEILEVGLAYWKVHLVDAIKRRLSSCLMREVLNDRMIVSGQQICIRPSLASFLLIGELRDVGKATMDLYNEIFQYPLLDATKFFYTNWASRREAEMTCAQYITEALALRDEEENRAMHYYKCSFDEIQSLFQEIIVKQRLEFLNQSVRTAVSEENKAELRNLFLILERSDPYSELNHWFGEHIKLRIHESILGLPRDANLAPSYFVESMLTICNRYAEFIDEVFDGVAPFRNQLDKAFKFSINERVQLQTKGASNSSKNLSPRPSELICRYLDSLLRKSSKSLSEQELETKLTAAISVFKHINDKDVFQKYYQRMLCKRLLANNSPVLEAMEETVINQLKAVCGYEFTGKFQRMFSDIQLSPELNQSFHQHLESKGQHFPFRHHFSVLTQCSWPIALSGSVEFTLPVELQQCNSAFEAFYTSTHQGRKMRWAHHHHSMVDLLVLFATGKPGDKPYQLQVPALHAVILLLFDSLDVDSLSFGDLLSSLQLATAMDTTGAESAVDSSTSATVAVSPEQEAAQRALVQLTEIGLLTLDPNNSEKPEKLPLEGGFSLDTQVVLNRSFASKRIKVRVAHGPITKETTQNEAEQVDKQVNEDRRYFIQAAIVRIMKSRKQLEHRVLIDNVLQQSNNRFQPPISLIKRCIESLIDKGYLERSPDDPDQYSYLA